MLTAALGQAPLSNATGVEGAEVRKFEVAGEVGAFTSGVYMNTPVLSLGSVVVGARARLAAPAWPSPWSHLLLEASLHGDLAFGDTSGHALLVQARVGAGFSTWRVTAGIWSNLCLRCSTQSNSGAQPPRMIAQVLPSLTFQWQPRFWGVSAGVLDEPIAMIGHIDLRMGEWAVGYSFPFGASLGWQHRVAQGVGLSVRAFGFTYFGAYQAGLMFGVSWLPD